MMTDDQIDYVSQMVNESSIKRKELRDDLIDHFCCLIELDLKRGHSFDVAMSRAYEQTCPEGLDEIQKETIFLLNYSKIMFMKRLTYVVGYLATLTWIAGLLMKVLHLPGAAVIMGIGAICIVCLFIPLLLINRYKHLASQVLSEKMKWILGAICVALVIASITMKMLHMMGAGLMLFISFLFLGFGLLPFLFFRMYKKSVEEL